MTHSNFTLTLRIVLQEKNLSAQETQLELRIDPVRVALALAV